MNTFWFYCYRYFIQYSTINLQSLPWRSLPSKLLISHTHMLKPSYPTSMSLEFRGKPKYTEKTHTRTGRTWNLHVCCFHSILVGPRTPVLTRYKCWPIRHLHYNNKGNIMYQSCLLIKGSFLKTRFLVCVYIKSVLTNWKTLGPSLH